MDTHTKNVSLEDLQNIVGADNAREATPEDDAVDGVVPSFVVEPGSATKAGSTPSTASSGVALRAYSAPTIRCRSSKETFFVRVSMRSP